MQSLWLKKCDWHDKLDLDTCKAIEDWIGDLKVIERMSFPRCLSYNHDQSVDTEIHIFVDASEDAYAAVAYQRSISNTGNNTSVLICSKTKVAPLEAISIPRLELLGAELGSEVGSKLMKDLHVKIDNVFYWTDSNDVLGWISNRSKLFKPFVAHRISKIHQNSSIGNWKKISSKLNIADIATRGKKAAELSNISQRS